jgi:hypothetical protein
MCRLWGLKRLNTFQGYFLIKDMDKLCQTKKQTTSATQLQALESNHAHIANHEHLRVHRNRAKDLRCILLGVML